MEKLTPKEEEIMGHFWEKGPLFVRELRELYVEPRPHFNTLSTQVRMLEEKGLLRHEAFGTTFRYEACVSREEIGRKTITDAIRRFFRGSYKQAVSALVKDENLSEAEIRELEEIMNKKDKE